MTEKEMGANPSTEQSKNPNEIGTDSDKISKKAATFLYCRKAWEDALNPQKTATGREKFAVFLSSLFITCVIYSVLHLAKAIAFVCVMSACLATLAGGLYLLAKYDNPKATEEAADKTSDEQKGSLFDKVSGYLSNKLSEVKERVGTLLTDLMVESARRKENKL